MRNMNINYPIVILFLLLISYCFSYNQNVLLNKLKRLKREETNFNESPNITKPLEYTCTLLFRNKEEIYESIRRGYFMSRLTIAGRNVKFSNIPKNEFCKGRTLVIELIATESVIFDEDFNSRGLDLTLVVAAPLWLIGLNRKIILNGANGESHASPKKVPNSIHGADGKEGFPGGPGGYFYGIGDEYNWQTANGEIINNTETKTYPLCYYSTDEFIEYFVCPYRIAKPIAGVGALNEPIDTDSKLRIYVNGGNGGRGQNGGDGEKGTDGTTFDLDPQKIERNGFVDGFDTILHEDVEPLANETYLGKGISEVIVGAMPEIGGRGGKAGPGGLAGQPGGVAMICVSNLYPFFRQEQSPDDIIVYGNEGAEGKQGASGLAGYSDSTGYDVQLSVYYTPSTKIQLRNIEFYPHVNPYTSRSLQNLGVSKRQNKQRIYRKFYTVYEAVEKYTNFTFFNLANTPNGRWQRNIFSALQDTYHSSWRLQSYA
ncbi:uncharacterized protein LOC122512555 [Leptopilina heterotoma]|uniref:uncharacterized protein LOC122512555 n=1 Tax=Leptopilina heterotoma TaxID=63436 RepID=UPI001CA95418|nr:uncharacterized protein LOC122512555 [Leptopilina heterotoma]